ncbi:MAG: septal ring lytic transglycosylase RlpA family protein [Alphaproteobacteria bacterium]|nr:septal ring lytic transglycosylase RlpA family protein [Alphaproteobacteria bacterium]
MRLTIKALATPCAALLLAGCGMVDGRGDNRLPGPPTRNGGRAVADYPVKIGAPYTVAGETYTPADTPNYEEVGYASWYGAAHEGKPTANGEAFRMEAISAAHKTLPLPSYVEVTSLDTGRTILVRVNDRGPFVRDRIIDLSSAAAQQLGLRRSGVAAVRVRRVNPPDQERAALRAGGQTAERLATPEPLLVVLRKRLGGQARPVLPVQQASISASAPERQTAPVKLVLPAPATGSGGYVVQVAAFSSKDRANALAVQIGAWTVEGNGLWRVRFGPYSSEAAAQQGVEKATAKGYANARIMANDRK